MSIRSLGSDLMPSDTLTVMIANVVNTIARIGPAYRLPKMMAVISAQIRPGVVTPMVTASRKNPFRNRFCIRMPIPIPTKNAIVNPTAIRASVVAKAPGTSPVAHNSPNVRNTVDGPGSSRSSISLPDASSQIPRKNT